MKRHIHALTAFGAVFAVTMAMLIAAHTGASATSDKKITFCHATGSATNPYVKLTTSLAAFYNSGHVSHSGDIYPAGSYRDQSWSAQGDQDVLYGGCVVTPPTEEPTEEPTETPTETPTIPTETPTVPTETPTVPTETPTVATETPTTVPPTVTPTVPAPTVPSTPTETPTPEDETETPEHDNPGQPEKHQPHQPEITTESYCLGNTWVTVTYSDGDKVKTSYGKQCSTTTDDGTPVEVIEEGL
jgi:hypothetical protein